MQSWFPEEGWLSVITYLLKIWNNCKKIWQEKKKKTDKVKKTLFHNQNYRKMHYEQLRKCSAHGKKDAVICREVSLFCYKVVKGQQTWREFTNMEIPIHISKQLFRETSWREINDLQVRKWYNPFVLFVLKSSVEANMMLLKMLSNKNQKQ